MNCSISGRQLPCTYDLFLFDILYLFFFPIFFSICPLSCFIFASSPFFSKNIKNWSVVQLAKTPEDVIVKYKSILLNIICTLSLSFVNTLRRWWGYLWLFLFFHFVYFSHFLLFFLQNAMGILNIMHKIKVILILTSIKKQCN